MKVRCYDNSYLEDCLTVGRIYDVKEIKENYYVIKDDKGITNLFWHGDFEIVKENEMEKTFREVIADIKEGEVWECRSKYIQRFADGIQIYHKEKGKSTPSMLMRNNDKFKLQRKEYTFEEAFKAYEEGKEIESCIKNFKIKKLNNKPHYIYKHMSEWDYINNDDACFSIDEIQGKWYINN